MKTLLTVLLLMLSSAFAGAQCGTKPIWVDHPEVNIYHLPTWYLPLTWSQPADIMVSGTAKKPIIFNSWPMPFIPVGSRAGESRLYCEWLMVEGGTPPYQYSLSGNVPPGITLKQFGNYAVYGGWAKVPGWYLVTLCATDATQTQVCLAPRSHHICDGGKSPCSIGEVQ